MTSSCSRGLGNATTFLTFLNCSRVVARPCTGSRRRPSAPREADAISARTSSGAVPSSNRLLKSSSRCAMNPCKDSASWCKGGGAARQWSDGEWQCKLCRGLWLQTSWTWSMPGRSAHSCSVRPTLLPSLNICCVCTACTRRLLLLLLWSQDRRASTARRCGSLLYIGMHHAERLASSGASADRRAASIP